MKETFLPLNDRVLVKPLQRATKQNSPLDLGSTQEAEVLQEGLVLAVSPAIFTIKNGDTVVFGSYAGKEMQYNGEIVKVLMWEEIHGIITREESVQ